MEITVRKSDIVNEVLLTQGVVERKTTIPILANLLIETGEDKINFAATDLDLGIKSSCPAKILETGSITTPAKNFLEIIRSLPPDREIKIKKLENSWAQIKCGSATFKIVGLPTDNFPTLPACETDLVQIPAKILLRLINNTIFSVAPEETRFALNGALLLLKPLSITMVATDGHRLAHIEKTHEFNNINTEISTLIPRKALFELQKILDGIDEKDQEKEMVSFGRDETHIFFSIGGRLMIARMLTGQFPNYEAVIPKDNKESIRLDKIDFQSAIERIALLADDKSRSIRVVLEDHKLEISSSNANLGEANEQIKTEYAGAKLELGFNCKYLLEFLKATEDHSISFDFKDSQSSGLLRPANEEEDYRYRYIVMPMRI
ncbi:MAG: DNA polymerase III subunit beta [Acidobacteriia bacterium]|nr:DNA polymerase III subunit beta [Terriglobia bacterium]